VIRVTTPFTVTRPITDGEIRLSVTGEVEVSTSHDMRTAIVDAATGQPTELIVDLDRSRFST
jgi:hypothetical protein